MISAGSEHDGLLVSATRILPRRAPPMPEIRSAVAEDDRIRIRLRGHGPDTRVSVVGMRYSHDRWNTGRGIHQFEPAWPDLKDEQKLDLLSKRACHELHLFER